MKKRNDLSKKIVITILLICIMLSQVSCGKSENGHRVVRIAQTGVYVSATAQIMREKGILEKHLPENVSVEWNQIATGPDLRDAIVSEKIDIADFSLMTYIAAYENNLPLTLLSFSGSTPINIYSADEQVVALEDFSSTSRIAITNKSTNLHIAFLAYSKEKMGDAMLYDGCLAPIPAADAISSLQTANDYNGAVFSFPMMVKAEAVEQVELIGDMTEVIQKYSIGDVFVTHSEFFEDNPDIIEAFLAAQEETLQYIEDNPDEVAEILSELYGVEKEAIKQVIETMPPSKEVVGYDKQAQLMYEAGILVKEATKFQDIPNYNNIPK